MVEHASARTIIDVPPLVSQVSRRNKYRHPERISPIQDADKFARLRALFENQIVSFLRVPLTVTPDR